MKPNLDLCPISGTYCLGSRFVGHLRPQQSVSLRWPLMRLVCSIIVQYVFRYLSHAQPSSRHHDIDIILAGSFFEHIESSMKAQTCHDPADVLVDLIADLLPLSATGLWMEDDALVPKALLPRA
jgi:hypothetical protein